MSSDFNKRSEARTGVNNLIDTACSKKKSEPNKSEAATGSPSAQLSVGEPSIALGGNNGG